MPNIFPPSKISHFRWHHLTANGCNSCDSTIKSLTFFFRLKNKIPLMKPLTLSKTFTYLLNFLSTSSNLATYLALYKEDQATHKREGGSIPLSSSIFWKFIHLAAHISKLLHATPLYTIHLSHTLIFWNLIILLPKNTSTSHSLFLIQNLPSWKTHDITQKTFQQQL